MSFKIGDLVEWRQTHSEEPAIIVGIESGTLTLTIYELYDLKDCEMYRVYGGNIVKFEKETIKCSK